MSDFATFRNLTITAVVAILLAASPAPAALEGKVLSCRSAIAKSYGKLLKTGNRTIAACHKDRDADVSLVGMDCNDLGVADAEDGKYASAVAKFTQSVERRCEGQAGILTAASTGREREFFVSCAIDPCDGVTGIIDTVGEIGACLACVATDVAQQVAVATLGLPDPASLDTDERRCHGAIAKRYGKYLSAGYKAEIDCQRDEDQAGNHALDACTNTPAGDADGRAADALAKASDALDKSCPAAVADLAGCSAVDLDSLKSCTAAAWGGAEDEAFTAAHELSATVCPTSVRTRVRAGCSTEGSSAGACSSGYETASWLPVGWKGMGHSGDVSDSFTFALDVTCAGTEAGSCGICTSTGISQDDPQYDDFVRCIDDPSVPCSNPFGTDPVCNGGSGGDCEFFLGPPRNMTGSGTPLCILDVVHSDIVGSTWNVELGAADFDIDLRWVVHHGVSQERPCPFCRDDATPQDGSKDGTCRGGARDGEACDVQGFDLTFAATNADNPTSGMSLDCPPNSGANVSGGGMVIPLPLSTGVSTNDAEDACESPNESLDCFCGMCSLAPGISCRNDADCMGVGECTSGSGAARKPNNCTDGICYAVVGQDAAGACSSDIAMTPDEDSYCDGVLRANGDGIISCGTDADCDAYISGSADPDDWVCPGDDCGDCGMTQTRSCFLDPIEISGTPDPSNPILAGTFCTGAMSSGSKNSAYGLPGPAAIRADSVVELRY